MLVGREAELSAITSALDAARVGRGSSLCLAGPPGIGKTSLLDAAESATTGFHCLRATGVESEFAFGHASLAEIIPPLRDRLWQIPPPQRAALEIATGWSAGGSPSGPFLVGAATVSLLSLASQELPILVVIDDLQWIDRESQTVLLFAARRMRHDAVVFLFARRDGETAPELVGINEFRLSGLTATASAALVSKRLTTRAVIERLVTETAGNPLAILEAARGLTPEQLRGSAPLPSVLPVGQRLSAGFLAHQSDLSAGARRALVIAAASMDHAAGPVVAALHDEGFDPAVSLAEAEQFGALILTDGSLTFRHPLIRAAVWQQASAADRRSAHGCIAAALVDRPAASIRHRAEAAIGFDDHLAAELHRLAIGERSRSGYAASSALFERAAQLSSAMTLAADAMASAVEDAVLSGDVLRARKLAVHGGRRFNRLSAAVQGQGAVRAGFPRTELGVRPSCGDAAAEGRGLGHGNRAAAGARRAGPGQLPAGLAAGRGRRRRSACRCRRPDRP